MNFVDYTLVFLYLGIMIWLGFRFKKNKASGEYFLGGRTFGWFALGLSVMASQLSVISFVSAPAFVGLRPEGGMQWLTFEFGVPIAMGILITTLGPALFKTNVISIYTFLEQRFGTSTRLLVSGVYLFSRSFATGVTIYAVTLILSNILHLAFWQTILIIAGITLLYSFEGGMKAIVYSEVIQMFIKLIGIILIIIFGLKYLGGYDGLIHHLDRRRLQVIYFNRSGFHGQEYGFWPMLLGGIFLYCSYYGTDQTQAQRILASKDEANVKKLLLFNGLCRFPITLAYCLGGLILGTLASTDAVFRAKIPLDKPDLMVPVFLSNYLPHGIIGVLVIAILASAMSSYSSNLNSLSAVTIEDFVLRVRKLEASSYNAVSKWLAGFWGVFTIILAFFVGNIAQTVIEAINKIGSLFYGPVIILFIMAFFSRKVNARNANIGLIAGVLFNIFLWLFCKNLFWFWWNATGATVTFLTSMLFSYVFNSGQENIIPIARLSIKWFSKENLILTGYFIFIFLFTWLFPRFFI